MEFTLQHSTIHKSLLCNQFKNGGQYCSHRRYCLLREINLLVINQTRFTQPCCHQDHCSLAVDVQWQQRIGIDYRQAIGPQAFFSQRVFATGDQLCNMAFP